MSDIKRRVMLHVLFPSLLVGVLFMAGLPATLRGEIQVSGPAVLLDISTLGDDQPQGITYHPLTHSFFMVTKKPGKVFELSLSGAVLRVFDINAITSAPEGIAYDPATGDLLVCKGNNSIYRISTDARLVLPSPYISIPETYNVKGIAVHPLTHNVFVADGQGHRILELNRQGSVISSFDTSPSGVMQPQGLSFRGTELLISDDKDSTHSVYLFSTTGTLLQKVVDLRDYGFKDPDGVIDVGQERICVTLDDDVALACFQTPQESFLVPYHSGLPASFVGYTYLNSGTEADYLNIQGLSPEGGLTHFKQDGPFVPSGQSSRLTREAFPASASVDGSTPHQFEHLAMPTQVPVPPPAFLKMQGQAGPAKGFFLTGDFALTHQDGLGDLPSPELQLYIPTAPVNPDTAAILFLYNSSTSRSASVSLALNDTKGLPIQTITRGLGPYGSLQQSLNSLFTPASPMEDGYISLTSDTPIRAFLLVHDGVNSVVVSARPPQENRRFIVPHFYVGNRQDTTRLRILNTDTAAATVTVSAFSDENQPLANEVFQIPPGELLEGDAADLLGIDPPPAGQTTPVLGFLEIDSHGPPFGPLFSPSRIVANARYIGLNGQTATSLNFIKEGASETCFPYVSLNSQLRIWQGLVIYNPDVSPVQVAVRAFDRDGAPSGERSILIPPHERVVGLLHEPMFFGPAFSQIGGHMVVSSSRPVISIAIVVGDRFFTMITGQAGPEQ